MENKTVPRKTTTKPDKREMMLIRNTFISVILISIGILIGLLSTGYLITNEQEINEKLHNENYKNKIENLLLRNTLVNNSKKKINLSDKYVIIKTSEIINLFTKKKKYFVSYKQFISNKNTEYNTIIREISFVDYMNLNSKDTININYFIK